LIVAYCGQGRRQQNFQGGQRKRGPKNSKKDRKIALLSFFQGDQRKKRPKNSKKKHEK